MLLWVDNIEYFEEGGEVLELDRLLEVYVRLFILLDEILHDAERGLRHKNDERP